MGPGGRVLFPHADHPHQRGPGGIGAEAARSLLTYAFASDIVARIKVEPVRRDLEEFLFARLPMGEVVRQAV